MSKIDRYKEGPRYCSTLAHYNGQSIFVDVPGGNRLSGCCRCGYAVEHPVNFVGEQLYCQLCVKELMSRGKQK